MGQFCTKNFNCELETDHIKISSPFISLFVKHCKSSCCKNKVDEPVQTEPKDVTKEDPKDESKEDSKDEQKDESKDEKE